MLNKRIWPIAVVFAFVVFWTLVTVGGSPVPIAYALAVLALLTLFAGESTLPILLLLVLALGSSYRADVSQKSFYLRFFVLGLVAVRGFWVLIKTRASRLATPGLGMTLVHMSLAFVGIYGVISSVASVAPAVSAQRATTFLCLFFVIFVYFWVRAESSERCANYAVAILCTLPMILGIGFLMLVAGVPGMMEEGRLRLIIGSPNLLGHYCALMTPIAVWTALDRAKGMWRYLAWAVLGMSVVVMFWTGSRGALVTVFGSVAVQVALSHREKLLFLFLAAALAAPVYFLRSDPPWKGRYDPSFVEEAIVRTYSLDTGAGRTDVWKSAKRLIDERPFFGYGFGSVDLLFDKRYFSDVPSNFRGSHVHNGYLEELINLGWIGASFLFLTIVYLLGFGFRVLWRPAVRSENYKLAGALFGVLVAGAISGVFESWFTSVGSLFCFPFWFCGMLFLRMILHFKDWRSPLSLPRV